MFDEPFRRRFGPLTAGLVTALARAGVTANAVTYASFVVALLSAVVVAGVDTRAGVALWLLSRVGDGLDGALARRTGSSSAFGGYLDITLDMSAYSVMVMAFGVAYPQHALAWAAVLAGYVVVITTTLALSDAARSTGTTLSDTGRTFQFTRGITEAGETSAAYVVWAIWPDQLWWTVWVWVAALLATGVQRTILARRWLR